MTSPAFEQARFESVAGYDRFMGRYSEALAPEFARAAGVPADEHVLDVGCGTGILTQVLAGVAGANRVAAVDPSEPFVAACRVRVPGADVRVARAESLPFADESFGCALAQLVFHFVEDRSAAAAEMRRVTRPGGRVAACVWDFTGGMTMLRAYWDAAREVDPNAPDERERFGGRPGELARLWREAGLGEVEQGSVQVSCRYQGFDELWESLTDAAGAVGAHVASLEAAKREALRHALRRQLGSPVGSFSLTARAWYAVGTV